MTTIVLCGGGTGGHITPLLAVGHELKKLRSDIRLVYIGEKGGKFGEIAKKSELFDEFYLISAGKYRRYHNEAWLKKLLDVKTNLLNVRDLGRFIKGTAEARRLLKKIKPNAIFIKGGFVGVPVGLAAARLKIPYITHDSDTLPGLANRIIARWASAHAVGMPAENYKYPKDKTFFVGTPVPADFKWVNEELQNKYKKALGLPLKSPVIFVTGGSQGAQRLNAVVEKAAYELLKSHSDLYLLHQAGRDHDKLYSDLPEDLKVRLQVFDFSPELYKYSGAADLIITRAGASTLAEFAVQGKACIVVPNPELTGGHQLTNAKHLSELEAVVVLEEKTLKNNTLILPETVSNLLKKPDLLLKLSNNLARASKPSSAKELAELIISKSR